MNAADLLQECCEVLNTAFGEDASDTAKELLAELLGVSALKIRLDSDRIVINEEIRRNALDVCRRRSVREPLQYIMGRADFMFGEFLVGPGVLIPRGDTERLVEKAAELISLSDGPVSFLELCTGTACVSISLIEFLRRAGIEVTGVATDISEEALAFANENRKMHGLEDALEIVRHDMLKDDFCSLVSCEEKFDLLVMNPPYIRSCVIEGLEPEVRVYEPRLALDGGDDGLVFYRAAVKAAVSVLRTGGWVIAEIGFDQADEVSEIFSETGVFDEIGVLSDHSGLPRVISARLVGR